MVGLVPWSFFLIAINITIPRSSPTVRSCRRSTSRRSRLFSGRPSRSSSRRSIEFAILAVVLAVFGNVGPTWLLFPAWLVLFVLFVNGIDEQRLAILDVYARDLAHITGVVLQLLFFLTPIIYPITPSSPRIGTVSRCGSSWPQNPLSEFVVSLRAIAYGLQVPDFPNWAMMIAWTVAAVGVTFFVYRHRGQDIGESDLTADAQSGETSPSNSFCTPNVEALKERFVRGRPPKAREFWALRDASFTSRAREHVRPARTERFGEVDDPQGPGGHLPAYQRPGRRQRAGLGAARARRRIPRGTDRA